MAHSYREPDVQESPAEFAQRLHLNINNLRLLHRALTHRSYLNENHDAVEDNERLEFLGDAVLDYLVAEWLYHRYPEMSEGQMTRLRSALVGTEQLAEFARDLNIGPAILLGRGEEEGGGRFRDGILCATFEAIIGAYTLESGVDEVRNFIEPLMIPIVDEIVANQSDKDSKSMLQEKAQSQGFGIPIYTLVDQTGPDHDRRYTIEVKVNDTKVGRGIGRSKQEASKAAARDALITLGG